MLKICWRYSEGILNVAWGYSANVLGVYWGVLEGYWGSVGGALGEYWGSILKLFWSMLKVFWGYAEAIFKVFWRFSAFKIWQPPHTHTHTHTYTQTHTHTPHSEFRCKWQQGVLIVMPYCTIPFRFDIKQLRVQACLKLALLALESVLTIHLASFVWEVFGIVRKFVHNQAKTWLSNSFVGLAAQWSPWPNP